MKADAAWARRIKRRLERAGFKVTLGDPSQSAAEKKSSRRRDFELLGKGRATPAQLQRRNSFFRGAAKRFKIVDYGGLDKP